MLSEPTDDTDDDAVAVLSSRSTNSIVLVNASTGETIMTVGGEYSDFDIVDLNGVTYGAGSSLWHGQHNAEYYGDVVDEWGDTVEAYGMFDNNFGRNASSRLLIVEVDEDEMVAPGVSEPVV